MSKAASSLASVCLEINIVDFAFYSTFALNGYYTPINSMLVINKLLALWLLSETYHFGVTKYYETSRNYNRENTNNLETMFIQHVEEGLNERNIDKYSVRLINWIFHWKMFWFQVFLSSLQNNPFVCILLLFVFSQLTFAHSLYIIMKYQPFDTIFGAINQMVLEACVSLFTGIFLIDAIGLYCMNGIPNFLSSHTDLLILILIMLSIALQGIRICIDLFIMIFQKLICRKKYLERFWKNAKTSKFASVYKQWKRRDRDLSKLSSITPRSSSRSRILLSGRGETTSILELASMEKIGEVKIKRPHNKALKMIIADEDAHLTTMPRFSTESEEAKKPGEKTGVTSKATSQKIQLLPSSGRMGPMTPQNFRTSTNPILKNLIDFEQKKSANKQSEKIFFKNRIKMSSMLQQKAQEAMEQTPNFKKANPLRAVDETALKKALQYGLPSGGLDVVDLRPPPRKLVIESPIQKVDTSKEKIELKNLKPMRKDVLESLFKRKLE